MFQKYSLIIFCAVLLASCGDSKRLTYFQDLSDTAKLQKVAAFAYKPLKLQNDDQLQITVSSASPEVSQYFNLGTAAAVAVAAGTAPTPSAGLINVYTIAANGNITLPVLGDVPAAGLTVEELKTKLTLQLKKSYIKDAIVSIKLVNFKVTVIGEVGKSTIVPVAGEQINVIEALTSAGDMTVYGRRNDIKVMRRTKDSVEVANLDIHKSGIFKSPYFQLQQNDVVYIEPITRKEKATRFISPIVSVVLSVFGVLASIAAIIISTKR